MSKNNHELELKKIGLNIAYYRKLKGISQIQLAEDAQISRTHLFNIKAPNVPTQISIETLLDIAKALDITPDNLLIFR